MSKITFKINGIKCSVDACTPRETTLNAYIRYVALLPGTKSMCQEGGCGACIVLVRARRYPTGDIETFSVNSCLVLVFSCSGWDIVTVEGLGSRVAGYSVVQCRIAAFSGTQCGYCTPGWVMQLTSLKDKNLTMAELERSFGSNTCRCTGYRSIIDTIHSFGSDASPALRQKIKDIEDLQLCNKTNRLCEKTNGFCTKTNELCLENGLETTKEDDDFLEEDYVKIDNIICIDFGKNILYYKVFEENDIFDLLFKHGTDSYILVDGNTAKGVFDNFKDPKLMIDISEVKSLKTYKLDQNLILGANLSIEDCIGIFKDIYTNHSGFDYLKEFVKHFELIAHVPVRKIGSLAGNLMIKHAHPFYQSDVFLLFECVGATITIKNGNRQSRVIPLTDFLKFDMGGELITAFELPPYSDSHVFRSYKIMPRNQNALAIVNAAFLFKIERKSGFIDTASIVFGNISPDFVHARGTERAISGHRVSDDKSLQAALRVLSQELRAKSKPPVPAPNTRVKLALGLLYKCILNLVPNQLVYEPYQSGGSIIERPVSKGTQDYQTNPGLYPLNQPVVKLEALIQSAGEARYANDAPPSARDVFAAFVLATTHSGEIDCIDVEQLQKIKGFLAIYTAKDIPGKNSFTFPGIQLQSEDEEILATKIKFYGQPIAVVVATTQHLAAEIAKKVNVKYKNVSNQTPVLTIDEAKKDSNRYIPGNAKIEPTGRGTDVTKVIKGVYEIGAQYHYYLEPLTCVVVPVDKGLEVYDSTQWIDLTQIAVARCLGIKESDVLVKVRRLGGGFGGKISRNVQVAAACAIVAKKMDRTCRFILPIRTNLTIAGRRLPCQCDYEVGVNDEGKIQYLNATIVEDAGWSNNENILDYVVGGFPNCYKTDYFNLKTATVLTDLPSNTFARAPGTAEGISSIEHIMEHIAFVLNKDPTDVRLINMRSEDNDLPSLIQDFKQRTNYEKRVKDVDIFNKNNRWRKKAISISVMSFPVIFYGNYSALVSIYRGDGTVTITTGGIEMGQGLNTKAAQVCAYELGIPLELVSVIPSYSFTCSNNVFSGSSITSESVCYSIIKACGILKERLKHIRDKMPEASWLEIIQAAGNEDTLIDLTAMYMMSDKEEDIGGYNAYAVTILEVELDVLMGRFQIDRVDILEDVGLSANPNIDVGQVEGGYIQGLGYYTSEKFVYEASTGKLLTNRSLNHHVPLATDIPVKFNIDLRYNSKNPKGVLGSKTCGEMGICTAQGINHALRRCIMESRKDSGYDVSKWINIAIPYDTESIINALDVKPEEFLIQKSRKASETL